MVVSRRTKEFVLVSFLAEQPAESESLETSLDDSAPEQHVEQPTPRGAQKSNRKARGEKLGDSCGELNKHSSRNASRLELRDCKPPNGIAVGYVVGSLSSFCELAAELPKLLASSVEGSFVRLESCLKSL